MAPERTTVVINLIAGPGAGKTICAWEIAEKLKKQGYIAEYVSEIAKEYVWEERFDLLDGSLVHQKALLDMQKHRIDRLIGKVDFVVTDAPLVLNSLYLTEGSPAEKEAYKQAVLEVFHSYTNFNIFVERGTSFEREGRIHTEEESRKLDSEITKMLRSSGIYYGTYKHDSVDVSISNMLKTWERVNKQEKDSENSKLSYKEGEKGEEVASEKKTGSERWKQVQLAVSGIKNRVRIMEVIQRDLSLTKSGENFKCCCPFHEEKTPSFVVNPKTNTFHCFGCGESGDTIDFTRRYYGLDFVSAVVKLDNDCGLHILDEEISAQKAAEIDNYQKKRSEEREKKEQQDQEYAQLQDRVAQLDKKLMAIHLTENSPIQELEDYFSLKSSYDAAVGELERLELLRYMERKGISKKLPGNQNSEEQNTRMKIKVECKPLEHTNQLPEGRNHIGDSVITINDSVRFPVKVMENQYGSRYIQMHVYSDKKYSYVVPRNKEIFGNWSNAVLSAYSPEITTEKVVGVGNTGEMTASVRSLRLTESGKIKAYAAIDIGELLTINSVKVIENENGQKYVAFPSLASIKGTEGQVVYPPAVSIINQELEAEIKDQVLQKYTQKLQERQEEKKTEINKGVKRFCEVQFGRDSGSFEISK